MINQRIQGQKQFFCNEFQFGGQQRWAASTCHHGRGVKGASPLRDMIVSACMSMCFCGHGRGAKGDHSKIVNPTNQCCVLILILGRILHHMYRAAASRQPTSLTFAARICVYVDMLLCRVALRLQSGAATYKIPIYLAATKFDRLNSCRMLVIIPCQAA